MMKKLIFVLWLVLGISPAFAQGNKVVQTGAKLATSGDIALRVARQVEKQAALHAVSAVPGMQLAQIANLPGQPFIHIQLPKPVNTTARVLPARLLNGYDFYSELCPTPGLRFLPQTFNNGSPSLFRGLALKDVGDLKNILTNGLELKKTAYSRLYFSTDIDMALSFSQAPTLPSSQANEAFIPVVVKVEVTPQLKRRRFLYHDDWENYVSMRNVPSRFLSEVVAFLEVDGKPGWYKAVLENDELVLRPAPADIIQSEKLIIHEFDFPNEPIWAGWRRIFKR